MRQTVFIADLHLSDDTPDLNRLFFRTLESWHGRLDALYILGDLFEVWFGDDVAGATAQQTASALKHFAQTAPVYLIHGNRDFLIGRRYADMAGITLLPEIQLIDLYGKKILISHGDEMCTADTGYQRFRRIIRFKPLQKLLLLLPAARRAKIAAGIRARSRLHKQQTGKSEISDVSPEGIAAALAAFPQADALIHGHTHRPAVHRHAAGGKTVCRYVIPDWYDAHGGYIRVTPEGITLEALPPPDANRPS